jgi:hypothetical protein
MEKAVEKLLEKVEFGDAQVFENMTVFPLCLTNGKAPEYLTLGEAMEKEVLKVEEVDEDGSVPELRALNEADVPVMLIDGEELIGAKQNRIVNTTILIQGNSTTVIPVSCVEQGRWSYDTPTFHSKKRMMSSNLRAMKARHVNDSRRRTGDFRADQGAIWDEISAKAERMSAESPSMAMAGIYEKKASSMQKYVNHFRLVDMQVGAVFVINGKIVGLDAFGKPKTFSDVHKKLIQSYALDAIDWLEEDKGDNVLKGDVTKFLEASQASTVDSSPSVAQGTDYRLEGKKLAGFALALDDEVLHLSVFVQENGAGRDRRSSRMQRFSNRRNHRS